MKTTLCRALAGLGCLALGVAATSFAAPALPERDARLREPWTYNTPRTFPTITSREQWLARREDIRRQILFSAGLWPMPDKAPLDAQIFDRTEHGDFSVEKVYIRTLPGFYLAGNLYRPLGKGPGPFPAVLNPHGHWTRGRLEDTTQGSIPARCIHQARMGMLAFAYDMVGYNDTQFADAAQEAGYNYHRRFGTQPEELLWNINLMGLQTWNSLRALDFLASLPDVDARRIGCTGASGGGTQTFILGAIDDRPAVLAPTVMVSHSMQGGCSCENMPGLRVEYSNMEIAAVPVPKPQIFVAATGDWTRMFLTVEGPAITSIYRLFGAEQAVRYPVLPFGHNYNQATREQVYAFFAEHLLKQNDPALAKERPYPAATNLDLRVFARRPRPADTLTIKGLSEQWKAQSLSQWQALRPIGPTSQKRYQETFLPAWRMALQVDTAPEVMAQTQAQQTVEGIQITRLVLGRAQRGDRLPAVWLAPAGRKPQGAVVLAHPAGRQAFLEEQGPPRGLARELLARRLQVLVLDVFQTGEVLDAEIAKKRAQQVELFFATYNRTDAQERVQDLITAATWFRQQTRQPVILCGVETAGVWALLAAPAVAAVAADLAELNPAEDATLLRPELFVPGLRRLGGLEGVALLAAPRPLLLHRSGGHLHLVPLQTAYQGLRNARALSHHEGRLADAELANWLATTAAGL
ncbi:MAG: acetylxylan esterase [Verrucomicrobiae bacterium]|nr:acetylxylan esterase [Verrucomicrobiae bacterium]